MGEMDYPVTWIHDSFVRLIVADFWYYGIKVLLLSIVY